MGSGLRQPSSPGVAARAWPWWSWAVRGNSIRPSNSIVSERRDCEVAIVNDLRGVRRKDFSCFDLMLAESGSGFVGDRPFREGDWLPNVPGDQAFCGGLRQDAAQDVVDLGQHSPLEAFIEVVGEGYEVP